MKVGDEKWDDEEERMERDTERRKIQRRRKGTMEKGRRVNE